MKSYGSSQGAFEDEVIAFMMKAIIVSACIAALMPSMVGALTATQTATPLYGRLYLDPDTGTYWVYIPQQEVR